jgi:DMSO/TMAO reductase YedYZ molybdopterin-dependent catalytic subunit
VLIVAALRAPERAQAGSSSRPVGSVIITGEVEDRGLLTFDQFEALPLQKQTVSVTFQSGQSQEDHTFTGFLLYDVLNYFNPEFDPDVKNDKLRFYVSATGTDGYQAIVAWGEFDPGFENKPILLAVTQDGESLSQTGVRLVVPDDIRGGRSVSFVDIISLDRAREPICHKHKPLKHPKC